MTVKNSPAIYTLVGVRGFSSVKIVKRFGDKSGYLLDKLNLTRK
jgi:hypothetical protein